MTSNPSPDDVIEPDLPQDLKILADAERINKYDRNNVFDSIKNYLDGKQHLPNPPKNHTPQSRAIQESSVTNLTRLLVDTPAELLSIEGYRRGVAFSGSEPTDLPAKGDRSDIFPKEFLVWQRERMDARQLTVWQSALAYGRCFVWLDNRRGKGKERYVILPTRRTVAYYRDQVNDPWPEIVVWFKRSPFIPNEADKARGRTPEKGRVVVITSTEVREYEWLATGKFKLATKPAMDPGEEAVAEPAVWKHGLSRNPVERFAFDMDDEGNTTGVVAPAIPAQNRVNLAVFNSDVLNTNSAFKQWWGTGVMPPPIIDPDTGKQRIDPVTGQPMFGRIETSPTDMLLSPDKDAKFGTLDETPQEGHQSHVAATMRNMAIIGRLPPHTFMDNLANIGADALDAVEANFQRWVRGSLQRHFGQSAEALLRLTAEAIGEAEGAESYGGEVRWKEFALRAFGAWMDGLGKAAEMLGVPRRALWSMIPGVTSGMIDSWEAMAPQQEAEDLVNPNSGPYQAAERENGSVFRQIPDATPMNDNGGRGGTFA